MDTEWMDGTTNGWARKMKVRKIKQTPVKKRSPNLKIKHNDDIMCSQCHTGASSNSPTNNCSVPWGTSVFVWLINYHGLAIKLCEVRCELREDWYISNDSCLIEKITPKGRVGLPCNSLSIFFLSKPIYSTISFLTDHISLCSLTYLLN